jgi:hypothetical protein
MLGDNPFIPEQSTDLLPEFKPSIGTDVPTQDFDINSILNGMGSVPGSFSSLNSYRGGSDNPIQDKLNALANRPTSSDYIATPTYFDIDRSGAKRYLESDYYKQIGYDPTLTPDQNEFRYGALQTWGDTMSQAFGGAYELGKDTFMEGWKGWGRMTEALFTWDSSKLMGSPEEQEEMAKAQEAIFNKYAIYDTAESRESIFNRQFFGNMLQQSGFALGAAAQMLLEYGLTAGIGSVIGSVGKAGNVFKMGQTLGELTNDARKVANTLTRSERIVNSIAEVPKALIPLYGTVQDINKIRGAGAGLAQMGMLGLGGIRKELSLFNMARSESIFEAASTYSDLRNKLIDEHVQATGQAPTADVLENISQKAEDASHDNFWTNMGVLSVMNRIQFDNMVNSFNSTKRLFTSNVGEVADQTLKVTGKIGDKTVTQGFSKGLLGTVSALPDIAKTFGKKTAAWEATKSIGRGLMKFEGSEGVQELIQEASSKGLNDYYYDLYNGKQGYGSKTDAVMDSLQNSMGTTEGMKTFLMGALTGRMIAPITGSVTKAVTFKSDQEKRKKAQEDLKIVNSFLKDPTNTIYAKEWVANTKVQNKAAQAMSEAIVKDSKYEFYNAKNSAFAKAVASSIKLDMYESLRDTLTELGQDLDETQFKEAFGMDLTEQNKGSVKEYMGKVVNEVEDYYNTYTTLRTKYADKIIPELFKNNGKDQYAIAIQAKKTLDDVIEVLATNTTMAKQAVARASKLQQEMAQRPTIGASSSDILTRLGSEESIVKELALLTKDIDQLTSIPADQLTPDQRKMLSEKKQEKRLVDLFLSGVTEIMNQDNESEFPGTETRAYKVFKDLVGFYNERSNISTPVSLQEVDDAFIAYTDYVKLNRDNRAYVDALNYLASPYNLRTLANAMASSREYIHGKFAEEHAEEIKKAVETPPVAPAEQPPTGQQPTGQTGDLGFSNLGKIGNQGLAIIEADLLKKGIHTTNVTKATPEQKAKMLADVEELKKKYPGKNITASIDGDIFTVKSLDLAQPPASTQPPTVNKPLEQYTLDELNALVDSIDDAEALYELSLKLEEIENNTSVTPVATVEGLNDVLNKIAEKVLAILNGPADDNKSKKTLKITDPEFVNAYNEALRKIQEVANKPDVTEDELRAAYKLLNPVFDNLSVEDQNKLRKENRAKFNQLLEQIRQVADSKDLNKHRTAINNIFKSKLSLAEIEEQVFDIINLQAHESLKPKLIEHFEKLYLDLIDDQLAKLKKNINTSGVAAVRTYLSNSYNRYKKELQDVLSGIKQSAQELGEKTKDIKLSVEADSSFENSTHRSILKRDNYRISEPQQAAVRTMLGTKLITSEEADTAEDRHSASDVINLGVARIHTLSVNKALNSLLFNYSDANYKRFIDIVERYFKEGNIDFTLEGAEKLPIRDQIKDAVDEVIQLIKEDKTLLKDKELADQLVSGILSKLNIPKTETLSEEQFKLISEFLINISKIQRYTNLQTKFQSVENFGQDVIRNNRSLSKEEFFDNDLLKEAFGASFRLSDNNLDDFKTSLQELFDKIEDSNDKKFVSESVSAFVAKTNSEIAEDKSKKPGAIYEDERMVESFLHMVMDTTSKMSNDQDGESTVGKLDEQEIIDAIINPTKSYSQQDLNQIEEFAKKNILNNFKSRFAAAIGFKFNNIQFTFDFLEPEYSSVEPRFSSLRPKFADDTRTTEQLEGELNVQDNKFSATRALAMVVKSRFSTKAEKVLAQKLMDILPRDLMVTVDNTLREAGVYDYIDGEVVVNLRAAGYVDGMPSVAVETVILHELIHQITAGELMNKDSEYRKTIAQLYNLVKANPSASTFYAFQENLSEEERLAEFVTEAFTNPAFQHLLSSIEYKNTKKSLWDRFVEVLNKVLETLNIFVAENVLNEVIAVTSDLFKEQPGARPFSQEIIEEEPAQQQPQEQQEQEQEPGEEEQPEPELPSVYVQVYNSIVSAKSDKDLRRIRKTIRVHERNGVLQQWQIKSLAAGMRAKKRSLNHIDLNSVYIRANKIVFNGKPYRYIFDDSGLQIFTLTRAGIRNVRSTVTRQAIIAELKNKAKGYNKLIPRSIRKTIMDMAGDPRDPSTYAGGGMNDSVSAGFARFPGFYEEGEAIAISLNFPSKEAFDRFMVRYSNAMRTKNMATRKTKLEELRGSMREDRYKEFVELYSMVGGIREIRDLVNSGVISWGGKGYTVTEAENIGGDLSEYLNYVLNGGNLGESEKETVEKEINKVLSDVFGMKISKEMQSDIEFELFQSDIDENTSEEEQEEDKPEEETPPPPPPGGDTPSGGTPGELVKVSSSLDPDVNIDSQRLDYRSVDTDKSKAARETYALRSKDVDILNGQETEHFKNFYYKVRDIVNKLSVMEPEKHLDLYVTLIKGDDVRIRWDGSAASTQRYLDSAGSNAGVIGYISDKDGNPIVFDPEANRVGVVDRNNMDERKGMDDGRNQIVYFNTVTSTTKFKEMKYEQESLKELLVAREKASKGEPQIAKVIHFSQGQMNNQVIADPTNTGNNKQNTKNFDFFKELQQQLGQFVHLGVNGKNLQIKVKDNSGAVNTHDLFPLATREVSIEAPGLPGSPKMSMFDYFMLLLQTYQEMKLNNDPSLTDAQTKMIDFLWNFWYTGSEAGFRIQQNMHTVEIKIQDPQTKQSTLRSVHLFDTTGGQVVMADPKTVNAVRNYINNRYVNISKKWLTNPNNFYFPAVVEENGKRKIVFEQKDYVKFLFKDIGLKTNLYQLSSPQERKRYHSQVHFNKPWTLERNDVPVVTEEQIIDNADTVTKSADSIIESIPEAPKPEQPLKRKKPGRWAAPAYDVFYEKICK